VLYAIAGACDRAAVESIDSAYPTGTISAPTIAYRADQANRASRLVENDAPAAPIAGQ